MVPQLTSIRYFSRVAQVVIFAGIAGRRPSLERQTTLYDDQYYASENSGYYPTIEITDTK